MDGGDTSPLWLRGRGARARDYLATPGGGGAQEKQRLAAADRTRSVIARLPLVNAPRPDTTVAVKAKQDSFCS
jgi:hypothetical protein